MLWQRRFLYEQRFALQLVCLFLAAWGYAQVALQFKCGKLHCQASSVYRALIAWNLSRSGPNLIYSKGSLPGFRPQLPRSHVLKGHASVLQIPLQLATFQRPLHSLNH